MDDDPPVMECDSLNDGDMELECSLLLHTSEDTVPLSDIVCKYHQFINNKSIYSFNIGEKIRYFSLCLRQ